MLDFEGEMDGHRSDSDPASGPENERHLDSNGVTTPRATREPAFPAYVFATLVVASSTLLSLLLSPYLDKVNLVSIYLLGVLITAARFGRAPSVWSALLCVAAYDFFLVPPLHTFAVDDTQYLFTFAVMLAAGLMVSTLTAQLRERVEDARRRERHTAALYALSRDLAQATTERSMLEAAVGRARATFGGEAVIFLPDERGRITPRTESWHRVRGGRTELAVAQATFERVTKEGSSVSSAIGIYRALETPGKVLGVLGIYPIDPRGFNSTEIAPFLDTFARELALSIERLRLSADAEAARSVSEREHMRNALLSSVSHDLRTPLATIVGATTTLLEADAGMSQSLRQELLASVADEARRLDRLVGNLLEMTRVEAGDIVARKDWHSIEEVVGVALSRLESEIRDHPVSMEISEDLPLVPLDEISIEQVLVNLIENAAKYSPAGSPILVRVEVADSAVAIEVLDRGSGIPRGDEERVFEKFYRARSGRNPGGLGLGLAICRAIVSAHGGVLEAITRAGGGTAFRFTLPLGSNAPSIPSEDLSLDRAVS